MTELHADPNTHDQPLPSAPDDAAMIEAESGVGNRPEGDGLRAHRRALLGPLVDRHRRLARGLRARVGRVVADAPRAVGGAALERGNKFERGRDVAADHGAVRDRAGHRALHCACRDKAKGSRFLRMDAATRSPWGS